MATLELVTEGATCVKRGGSANQREGAGQLHALRKATTLRSLMNVRRITKGDFDRIVEVIDHWWGGPISTFAHPIFFYELGEQALVVEQGSEMIGFLLGFLSPGPDTDTEAAAAKGGRTGNVHLVGIHPDYRRRGVGRLLYDRFTQECREAHCLRMKAITTPGNEGSIRFHLALGWGVQEVDDYAGPGRRRIVFTKLLV
jgi:GNAT superfamily N-acetyltransferase